MIAAANLDVLAEIQSKGKEYGKQDTFKGKSVLVEFVSANPHGPITVENGRCGVVGDVLSNLLEAVGYKVTREYYVNDVLNSVQMENLGRSLEVRYLQALGHDVQLPDDGYQGDYVVQIARKIVEQDGDKHVHLPRRERVELFTRIGQREMLEWNKADLDSIGVKFDNWYSERDLFNSGKVDEALEEIKKRNYAYEKGDAIWLKSTEFGDEVDRPLVRKGGQATYIASDAAYHKDKFDRGFDQLINVWGPQHQTYVVRTMAAIESLGCQPERLRVLIHQIVRLFSGGEQVMMAKRRGDFVALAKLVDEVGCDAARFFLLSKEVGEALDFDLDLARAESDENPLYAAQQAHLKMSRILKQAEQEGTPVASLKVDTSRLSSPEETALIEKLTLYPEVIKTAAAEYAPHLLITYTAGLAAAFGDFNLKSSNGSESSDVRNARLKLAYGARVVMENVLSMIGVTAPDSES